MIIVYILIAILMFGLLIAVHEFGHFIAAKSLGVKVNEFAIGMGPRLLHTRRGETEYTLRLFPIGGFCAMEGEGEDSNDPRAFNNKPAWRRFIILVAGAFMNFLTGVLIFLFLSMGIGQYTTTNVGSFLEGFTAQGESGLMPGDRIVRVEGHAIYLNSDIQLFFSRGGDTLDIEVERDGERVALDGLYMPYREYVRDGETVKLRGLTFAKKEASLSDKLRLTWYESIDTVRVVWISLGDLVSGAVGVRDMSGVVGIVGMMSDVGTQAQADAQENGQNWVAAVVMSILNFTALIAVNLAVMNLLPIPALDGGQILFLLVDKVYSLFSRRHISQKYLGYINAAGFLCLIGLMVVVAFSDVMKLFGR